MMSQMAGKWPPTKRLRHRTAATNSLNSQHCILVFSYSIRSTKSTQQNASGTTTVLSLRSLSLSLSRSPTLTSRLGPSFADSRRRVIFLSFVFHIFPTVTTFQIHFSLPPHALIRPKPSAIDGPRAPAAAFHTPDAYFRGYTNIF